MDLIPLMGARMVRAAEHGQGSRLQEAAIRELTKGEPLIERALAADFVEVRPQFRVTIVSHKPGLKITTTMEAVSEDRPDGEADN